MQSCPDSAWNLFSLLEVIAMVGKGFAVQTFSHVNLTGVFCLFY